MGQKRITRAEAQRGMTRIENTLENCDSYAGEVQSRVRAELGSVPPQQEGDMLENEEQMNQHYKKVSDILTAKAKADAEKCIPEEDDLKIAERNLQTRKVELERLKLLKTDPVLDERQWQVLSDIKARLLEYPALLKEVTGDKTFLEGIKTNYLSQLEGYETKLDSLIDDVYSLHMTCSDNVETSLAAFARSTLTPAIDIVKIQHERLETELGEAAERSEQLDRRIEELLEEAENAGAEKRRKDMEHQAREESLRQEMAALKKKFEDEREKHKRETTDLKSQLETARTSAAEQVKVFQEELQSSSETVKDLTKDKKALEEKVQVWTGRVSDRRQENDELRASNKANEERLSRAQDQIFSLEEGLRAEKIEKEAVQSQLSTAMSGFDSLKQSSDRQIETLQSQLSKVKEEFQSLQSQLSTAESEKRLLKHSLETEIQSVRNQLSTANDASESLARSKQELETRYGRATEVSQSISRLLKWQISAFDNLSMGVLELEDVFCEMAAIVDTMERYAGSTTEVVSMPKYLPALTLLGKVTTEPNLAAARQLWISSRCGSLDVAQAFFMQQEIPSTQFALLPWIHASLNCAVTTMCERSLTPDMASSLLWILQGLVYTATVAREWPEDYEWSPKIVEILTRITNWLGEQVPNEASFLVMVAHQVNEIVIARESPSTSISPNLFAEAQRIDSTNSHIPDGMTMVIDKSGMIVLFTADNAFVFGASEIKVVEFDNRGIVVFIFESQLSGLPENLRQIRLHDCNRSEAVNQHQRLLNTVLPKERLVLVSVRKYHK